LLARSRKAQEEIPICLQPGNPTRLRNPTREEEAEADAEFVRKRIFNLMADLPVQQVKKEEPRTPKR
jgi:hypothetical protein